MDGLLGAELRVHFPEQVDQLGVHAGRFVLAPIPHDPVDLLHRRGDVLAVLLVLDRYGFLGVDVV